MCYHSKLHTPKTTYQFYSKHTLLCYHSKLHTPKTPVIDCLSLFVLCYHSKLHTPKTTILCVTIQRKLCYHSKLHTPKTSVTSHQQMKSCVTIQNYIHLKPQFYIFITIHFPYKNEISTIYSEFIKNSISNSNISFI